MLTLCTSETTPYAYIWTKKLNKATEIASLDSQTELIMLGDFNTDLFKNVPQHWTDMVELYNLTQLIKTPTRISDKSQTLLDHIHTNKPENVCADNVPVYAIYDH